MDLKPMNLKELQRLELVMRTANVALAVHVGQRPYLASLSHLKSTHLAHLHLRISRRRPTSADIF
jgi:hypothetical protein